MMAVPGLVMIALTLALLAGITSLWMAGRFARLKRGSPSHVLAPAPRPGQGTALDALLEPLESRHAGHSAAALIRDPAEALRRRLALAQGAGRSLDLLYYIWEDDLSGRLLAQALLAAADRGVRVRLLLDDVNVLNRDPVYRALDRHPRIEVRLFNPIRNRDRGLQRGLEIVLSLIPYNRRMHGKLWIADGRLALSGGRNIGDAYFGLLDGRGHDYDDLDVMLAGPVLREAESLFDAFWNSGLARPIRTLWPGKSTRLRRFRARLARDLNQPQATALLAPLALPDPGEGAAALGLERLRWARVITFLGDPPQKALGKGAEGWMPQSLLPLLRDARRSVRIMTPYFVPGSEGLAALGALVRAGVEVEVITNGLALADNVLVHGAYRWYRARALAQGVHIFEVAAHQGPPRMLHSKALLVDGRRGFVGSFNFDLRSAFLNTELGTVFDEETLVADLSVIFETARAPGNAYRVALDGRFPAWSRGDGPASHLEPDSTWSKRAVSFCVGHLPIHRFL